MTEKSQIYTYESVGEKLFKIQASRVRSFHVRRVLHVTWFERAGTLIFTVITENGDIKPGGESEISNPEDTIIPILKQVAAFIKETSRIRAHSKDAKESQELNLAGYGKRLFNTIVPKELMKEISTWPRGCWVTISTNEQWVPWELLYDQDGFLVDRFMLFRLPRINISSKEKPKKTKVKAKPYNLSEVNDGKMILHVLGGDLTEDRLKRSEEHFKKRDKSYKLVKLKQKKVADLSKNLSRATLIHFTCHGLTNPLRLQVSDVDSQVFNLTIPAMEVIEVKEGCMVFANACNSGVAEFLFAEFTSFGWEFYKRGTAAFIGTLGTVPVDNALQFAQLFYDYLFETGDLCNAFSSAKVRTEGPTRLLYCFYANPLSLAKLKLCREED